MGMRKLMRILFPALVIFAIIISSFSSLVSAEDEWLYSNSARINVSVKSALNAYQTMDSYIFEEMTVNLSFIPKNTERQLVYARYQPSPASIGDSLIFKTYDIGKYAFGYDAEVKTTSNIRRVKEKIPFPAQVPEEFKAYTLPAKRIDSNDLTIIKAASKLAEGEDDYYVVVDKMADFVNKEVEYNLSTLFIKGTKDASWVLRNKEGVCSEITVLFIAMLRSVGIPARFVSGISYTNSPLFSYNFGPHAWAEVYFPGVGWIPYDITYGEFGYIDLGHVEMRKSIDASETSTSYSWKARNVEVEAEDVKITGNIIEKSDVPAKQVSITVKPYLERIGFLSYQIIEADIENLKDNYISKKIRMAKTEDLDFFESEKQIVLRPLETKKIYFITRTQHLDDDFYYTFPITIYTEQNETGKAKFDSSDSWQVLSESEMQDVLTELNKQFLVEKKMAKDARLDCFTREYYVDELITLKCDLLNTGNYYLENFSACIGEDCRHLDLGIGRSEKLNYTLSLDDAGKNNVQVNLAAAQGYSRTEILELDILELPKISIISYDSPKNVSFEDEFKVSYTIEKMSRSEPKRIIGEIDVEGDKRKLQIEDLQDKFKIDATLKGSDLLENSKVSFKVTYEDALGRAYEDTEEAALTLNPLTFEQKIRVLFNNVLSFFQKLLN